MSSRRQRGGMPERRLLGLAGALGAGLAVDLVWVVLTAATGKTYHLAPVIAAGAPGVLLRGRWQHRWPPALIGVLGGGDWVGGDRAVRDRADRDDLAR